MGVLDVDPADKADAAIDHGDLPVVTQVDLEASLQRVGLSDRADLDTRLVGAFEEAGQVSVGGAETIVEKPALYSRAGPIDKQVQQLTPDSVTSVDERLKMYR